MDKAAIGLCLLINQRERNQAIGVAHDTQHLSGLSAFVRSAVEEETKSHLQTLGRAAYLKAMVEEHARLADRLGDYITANIEDDKIRRDGLEAMSNLDAYITHLGVELEAIL